MRESGPAWAVLVLELTEGIPEGIVAELSGSLGGESLGSETTELRQGGACLRIYVDTLAEAAALRWRARERLAEWGVAPEQWSARVEAVEDLRWVETYQAGLRPFPLGERFLVVPNGGDHVEAGRTSIKLVPGRAFGTGEHPTTRLCAAALERWVEPGSCWLDLGCGSGILALVAVHRAASLVHARDDDPEAIEVAREVIEANRATRRVALALGSADDLAGAELDGVVANIAAPYFLTRATDAAAPLRRAGVLIAAGFLVAETGDIERVLVQAGLLPVEQTDSEGWGLLVARRGPTSGTRP